MILCCCGVVGCGGTHIHFNLAAYDPFSPYTQEELIADREVVVGAELSDGGDMLANIINQVC